MSETAKERIIMDLRFWFFILVMFWVILNVITLFQIIDIISYSLVITIILTILILIIPCYFLSITKTTLFMLITYKFSSLKKEIKRMKQLDDKVIEVITTYEGIEYVDNLKKIIAVCFVEGLKKSKIKMGLKDLLMSEIVIKVENSDVELRFLVFDLLSKDKFFIDRYNLMDMYNKFGLLQSLYC